MNEEEMRKLSEMLASMPGAPKSIRITIRYDETLQAITGKVEDPMFASEGTTFLSCLDSIFEEHPEIMRRYPPGTLGLSINGIPPRAHSPLFDGDVVEVSVVLRGR